MAPKRSTPSRAAFGARPKSWKRAERHAGGDHDGVYGQRLRPSYPNFSTGAGGRYLYDQPHDHARLPDPSVHLCNEHYCFRRDLGRLQRPAEGVAFTSYNPTISAMTSVSVASYLYDSTGHLRQAWDPRISPNMVNTYTYDGNSRLSTIAPAGLSAWTLGYSTATGTSGWLTTVSQPDPTGPTATTTVAYGVPFDATGPVNLSAASTAAWGRWVNTVHLDPPLLQSPRSPYSPPTTCPQVRQLLDWPYADLTYLDVNGRAVNIAYHASSGWRVGAQQYDASGNAIWSISPGNLAQAATPTAATDPAVAAMPTESTAANALATVSTFSTDGTRS